MTTANFVRDELNRLDHRLSDVRIVLKSQSRGLRRLGYTESKFITRNITIVLHLDTIGTFTKSLRDGDFENELLDVVRHEAAHAADTYDQWRLYTDKIMSWSQIQAVHKPHGAPWKGYARRFGARPRATQKMGVSASSPQPPRRPLVAASSVRSTRLTASGLRCDSCFTVHSPHQIECW